MLDIFRVYLIKWQLWHPAIMTDLITYSVHLTVSPCLACLSGGQTLFRTVSGLFPDESAAGKPSWSLRRTQRPTPQKGVRRLRVKVLTKVKSYRIFPHSYVHRNIDQGNGFLRLHRFYLCCIFCVAIKLASPSCKIYNMTCSYYRILNMWL